MDSKIVKFFIWFILICLWNFGVPEATPLYDVLVAVILSFAMRIKFPFN